MLPAKAKMINVAQETTVPFTSVGLTAVTEGSQCRHQQTNDFYIQDPQNLLSLTRERFKNNAIVIDLLLKAMKEVEALCPESINGETFINRAKKWLSNPELLQEIEKDKLYIDQKFEGKL